MVCKYAGILDRFGKGIKTNTGNLPVKEALFNYIDISNVVLQFPFE